MENERPVACGHEPLHWENLTPATALASAADRAEGGPGVFVGLFAYVQGAATVAAFGFFADMPNAIPLG